MLSKAVKALLSELSECLDGTFKERILEVLAAEARQLEHRQKLKQERVIDAAAREQRIQNRFKLLQSLNVRCRDCDSYGKNCFDDRAYESSSPCYQFKSKRLDVHEII